MWVGMGGKNPNVDALLEVSSVAGKAIEIAERSLADVRNEPVNSVPLLQALHEEAEHLVFAEQPKRWAAIRPQQERHAFSGLAPASIDPSQ